MSKANGSKNGTAKATITSKDAPALDTPATIQNTVPTAAPEQELRGKPEEVANSLAAAARETGKDAEKNVAKAEEKDKDAITGATSMVEAGRDYVAAQLKKMREAEPTAREGKDREGVHDMRVATRRLRENLRLLGETVFNPVETDALRKELKKLAATLGEARDTDVFLEHLDTYDAQLPVDQRAGLEPLRKVLHKRYKRSHKALRKLLDDPKLEKLYDNLEKFSKAKKVIADSTDLDNPEVAPSLVRHFAGSFIWRRYEAVLAYDTEIGPETSEETLHRLRISFKRLRYTIEFFEEALSPTIKNLHDQLVQAQDDLGAIHDDFAANLYLSQTVLDTKKPDEALLKYRDSRDIDSRKMRQDFLQRWKSLSGPKFKKQLATEIANLGVS